MFSKSSLKLLEPKWIILESNEKFAFMLASWSYVEGIYKIVSLSESSDEKNNKRLYS